MKPEEIAPNNATLVVRGLALAPFAVPAYFIPWVVGLSIAQAFGDAGSLDIPDMLVFGFVVSFFGLFIAFVAVVFWGLPVSLVLSRCGIRSAFVYALAGALPTLVVYALNLEWPDPMGLLFLVAPGVLVALAYWRLAIYPQAATDHSALPSR